MKGRSSILEDLMQLPWPVGAVLARLQPEVGALVVESPLLKNTMLTDAVTKDAGAIVGQLPTAQQRP